MTFVYTNHLKSELEGEVVVDHIAMNITVACSSDKEDAAVCQPRDGLTIAGGAPQGGQGPGGRPPNLSIGGGIAPPTLGSNTKGCLRVHYCLYSVTVYTG